jgi:hypothetical protein
MVPWILFAVVCVLLYRQSSHAGGKGGATQVASNSAAHTANELLAREDRPVNQRIDPKSLPPWAWLLLGSLYVACPLDGDFIPVVGWVDDLVVAYFAVQKWRKGA